jgi:hypothetical protein
MASPQDILNDPNYKNANAATKRAIFERRIAVMPEYRNANAATQGHIRQRFGIDVSPQAQPTPEAQQPWYESALWGFGRGLKPVADIANAINPLTYIGNAAEEYMFPGAQQRRQRVEAVAAAQAQQAQRQNPISYGGGKLAGNIVATAPAGPLLATGARAVAGGTRVGEAVAAALESGGFRTGLLPTRAAVKAATAVAPTLGARAVDLALRAGAGATTGAVSAGVTGDDAIAGALGGALFPTLGSTIARTAADKVILPAWERLSGQLGTQRAAAIFRKAFNMPYEAVLNLARNAPVGVPFAKVVAQAGEHEPAFQALAAKMAEGPGKHIYGPIARAETEAQQATLNAMAKGGTEREARNAFAEGRKAIGNTYKTAEEQAFERANLGAQGIHALETSPLATQIRGLKQAEGLSSTQRSALESIAQEIESHGPIIRAGDLDAIRKDANVTVAKLLGPNVDVGGVKNATAELVGRIKPFIDNAIEGAGGAGYKEAKAGFAAGATELERQKFAGNLAGVFEQNPEQFARTVRGAYGTTGAVEEAFPRAGARNFDIQEMMGVPGGAAGPSRMPALENIAGGVELNSRMAAQAGEGEHLASDLLKNPPQEADIFHKYSPVGMVGSATGALLKFTKILSESGLDRQTQQALAEGFRNGKTAEELLTTIPLADRVQLQRRLAGYGAVRAPVVRNAFNTLYGAATAVPSGQTLVGVGTGPSGELYPMYGEPSQNQNAMVGY